MRFHTALVNWHNQQAIYSLDFHPSGRIATGGADRLVKIWKLSLEPFKVDFLATLSGHVGPVHAVRFSPDGTLLATICDGGFLKLWRLDVEGAVKRDFADDVHEFDVERWQNVKQFKGCQQGLYDVAWSPCSRYLLTASLDNTAQVWDVHGHKAKMHEFTEHQHFVQGVAWDPWNAALVTQSSDRTLRVFARKKYGQTKTAFLRPVTVRTRTIRVVKKTDKDVAMIELDADSNAAPETPTPAPAAMMNDNDSGTSTGNALLVSDVSVKMFHGENLATFFRRCAFSPDGRLLAAPTGIIVSDPESDDVPENTTFVFGRANWAAPLYHLPCLNKPSLAVRFSPNLYKLKGKENVAGLPYRMLVAVAALDCLTIYDTQHAHPLALIQDAHYADLSDLAWSADGLILAVSSQDGYCSFLMFGEVELGERLSREEESEAMRATARARSFEDEKEWTEKVVQRKWKTSEGGKKKTAKGGVKRAREDKKDDEVNASLNSSINSSINQSGLSAEGEEKEPSTKKRRVQPELLSTVPLSATSAASSSALLSISTLPSLVTSTSTSPAREAPPTTTCQAVEKRRITPTLVSPAPVLTTPVKTATPQKEVTKPHEVAPPATQTSAKSTLNLQSTPREGAKSAVDATPKLERFFAVRKTTTSWKDAKDKGGSEGNVTAPIVIDESSNPAQ